MVSIAIYVSVAASLLASTFATECCPPLWTQFNDNCYRYIGAPKTWSEADIKCQELANTVGKAGHLVSIHSSDENDFVHQLWKSSLTPIEATSEWIDRNNSLWIGLTSDGIKSAFVWNDKSTVLFTQWRQNEPSNSPGEDCGHMWTFGDIESNWNDASCNYELPFVCKLGPNTQISTNQQILSERPKVENDTQSAYVCEHQTLHLECGPEQGISILSANYGRLDRTTCSDNPWNTDTDSCTSDTSLNIVRANCETFRMCDVSATYNVFGNPCGDIFKYLEVEYTCVDRSTTRSYVCENANLHLECSDGEVLSVESANFGRLNRNVCNNNEFDKNTDTCRTYNTLSIVQANCDNLRACDISATTTMFGNPCGNIFKYLEVTYSCKESTSFRAVACEHDTLHIECEEGKSIYVKAANYGRLHRNVCSNNQWNKNTDSCLSNTSLSIARQACDNYPSCDIPATNEKFGNPCGDIYKYLEVIYTCEEVDNTQLQSGYVCEHDAIHLECGLSQGISILSANYGRLNRVICSDNPWNTDSDTCYSATSLGIMRSNCETFQSCDVAATNLVFGNPCGNIFKYLEVMYVCQERPSLSKYACEHDNLHLECSQGHVLAIESANYGRINRDVCSNNEYNKNADSCRTYNSLYIVKANCDNLRSCDVAATNTMFGNPCGSVFKYLQVIYKCKESKTIRDYACENQTLHLECSEGELITIQSANYGRLHRNVCSNNQLNKNTHSCQSNSSLSIVRENCDNTQSCDMPATNEEFGNPCGDIYKYLEVFYTCEADDKSPLTTF